MNFNTHHRYIVALRIRIRVLRAHCGFRNEELIEPRLNQVHILNPKLLTLCSPQKKPEALISARSNQNLETLNHLRG